MHPITGERWGWYLKLPSSACCALFSKLSVKHLPFYMCFVNSSEVWPNTEIYISRDGVNFYGPESEYTPLGSYNVLIRSLVYFHFPQRAHLPWRTPLSGLCTSTYCWCVRMKVLSVRPTCAASGASMLLGWTGRTLYTWINTTVPLGWADKPFVFHILALNNNDWHQKMSQRYFCSAEYTTKTKPKTNQKSNPNPKGWFMRTKQA